MSMRNPNGFIRPSYNPLEVADAPTAVIPTADNQSASVDFTPPSNVGGSAVSEYYAVVNPGNITATSVTPPVAVTGLTNGVEYTTRVWANNSYGPSPYSAESAGFTPAATFIEDVFSTYLYNGTGADQTITNGVDLAGAGGMVWFKRRNTTAVNSFIFDTERGVGNYISTNSTAAQSNLEGISAFNTDGFSVGTAITTGMNASGGTYASWTFRKRKKFFDVVTWTGDGTNGRQIAHGLDAEPGMMLFKAAIGDTSGWLIYHRSNGATKAMFFDDGTPSVNAAWYNNTEPTSTHFTLGTYPNAVGITWVAYLFAHDAGGFGESDNDNAISCGSYTSATGLNIDLGYEPQWLFIKKTNTLGNWIMLDTMRGIPTGSADAVVYANINNAEASSDCASVNATGFQPLGLANDAGASYIYMAIRRGPMKTPESGANIYKPIAYTGDGSTRTQSVGWPIDLSINMTRNFAGDAPTWNDRLRGTGRDLYSSSTQVEANNGTAGVQFDNQTNLIVPSYRIGNGDTYIDWVFRRAPGFFDVVAYTGTGVARTVNHNLGVAPELMIVKKRSGNGSWCVYHEGVAVDPETDYLFLESTAAASDSTSFWNDTAPTSTNFTVGTYTGVNLNAETFVAYLFASCPGVSKVGSYTGTSADLNVDCGFSAGARFVLIKRTDSTGDWYVWDSARGITAGNDPYLLLNSTAAEVTNTDYVDTLASGFTVTSSAPAALNASGGNYIFLAIA